MTTLKSLACSIIFRGIPLPNYDITIWGIQHGSTLRDRPNLSRISRQRHSTIKNANNLMCGLCGEQGSQPFRPEAANKPPTQCHLAIRIVVILNKPKALHQCFDALQVRDHLVRHLKKNQRTKLLGKPSHLPSGSSCYMLFHVKYIYI